MEYFSDRYSRHKSLAMPLRRRCCTPQTALHDLFLRFMISGLDRPKPKHSDDLLRVVTISIHTNCTLQFWWPLLCISQPARQTSRFEWIFSRSRMHDVIVIIKRLFSTCCRVWARKQVECDADRIMTMRKLLAIKFVMMAARRRMTTDWLSIHILIMTFQPETFGKWEVSTTPWG